MKKKTNSVVTRKNNGLPETCQFPSVVVLIIIHKPRPDFYESISLRQCAAILGVYKLVLICPEGFDASAYLEISERFETDQIDQSWQSSYSNFNRLKVSLFLYERYRQYEHIFFYEPDAFVFSDQLPHWCAAGYDYIGAPWYQGFNKAAPSSPCIGVGNGGFSLRNTHAAIKALKSFSYIKAPSILYQDWRLRPKSKAAIVELLKHLTIKNNTYHKFNDFTGHEDVFWGMVVARNFSWFRIPDEADARRFSLEVNPAHWYEIDGRRLPFGCHAWWKHDFDFWRPHINKFGYEL